MVNETRVVFICGDITLQNTEAIVNAANSTLLGGGGVDGAIHRVGGPQILEECKMIRAWQGGCPTGEAVITAGGNLMAKYVIHTVGPIWYGGEHGEANLLRNAYLNSLILAAAKGIGSIAFPSISTGAYRFPVEQAAKVAVSVVHQFAQVNTNPSEIRFVLFSERDLNVYHETWKSIYANNLA